MPNTAERSVPNTSERDRTGRGKAERLFRADRVIRSPLAQIRRGCIIVHKPMASRHITNYNMGMDGAPVPSDSSAAPIDWISRINGLQLKNDHYRNARGGRAAFLTLFCSKCKVPLLLYQKDGGGGLQRCYLNRIFAPLHLEVLQRKDGVSQPADLDALKCEHCNAVIGCPMRHHDGRLAFRLHRGTFIKKWGIKRSAE